MSYSEYEYATLYAEVERLQKALMFYAYDGDWNSSEMEGDGGAVARKALGPAFKPADWVLVDE